jgi:hypothetical protein
VERASEGVRGEAVRKLCCPANGHCASLAISYCEESCFYTGTSSISTDRSPTLPQGSLPSAKSRVFTQTPLLSLRIAHVLCCKNRFLLQRAIFLRRYLFYLCGSLTYSAARMSHGAPV